MRFHIHKWSPLAPLGDDKYRWFSMCLKGTCTAVKIVDKR